MGDIADYYVDMAEAHEHELFLQAQSKSLPKQQDFKWWVMGNGDRILVSEMTTIHLMNSINKIRNMGGGWREQWHEPLMNELNARQNEANEGCDATASDIY